MRASCRGSVLWSVGVVWSFVQSACALDIFITLLATRLTQAARGGSDDDASVSAGGCSGNGEEEESRKDIVA